MLLAAALMVIALVTSPDGSGSLIDPHGLVSPGRMQHLLARIPQHGLELGYPSARVTVTEYTDLQCAACALYSLALFPQILSRYVESGKVKLVLGVLSFIGPDSVLAGRAAIAASYQGKLWNFVDVFYFRQEAYNSGYVNDASLRQVGAAVPGLDVARMMRDLPLRATEAVLEAATAAAIAGGAQAAPSFIVTGRRLQPTLVQGAVGLEQAINLALAG